MTTLPVNQSMVELNTSPTPEKILIAWRDTENVTDSPTHFLDNDCVRKYITFHAQHLLCTSQEYNLYTLYTLFKSNGIEVSYWSRFLWIQDREGRSVVQIVIAIIGVVLGIALLITLCEFMSR